MSNNRKTICALCGKEIKLTEDVLLNGCPFCGSFKFRSVYIPSEEEEKIEKIDFTVKQELGKTTVKEGIEAIRLTDDGVFEIDIEKLMEINEGYPLIMRNKDGSYYIKIEERKEKNKKDGG